MRRFLLSIVLFFSAIGVHAQPGVVNYCVTGETNTGALNTAPCTVNNPLPTTGSATLTGALPAGSNTIGSVSLVQGGNTAVINSAGAQSVALTPSASAAYGIAPVVSAAAEATHVLKASAGNLYSVYATNLTATAGFLVILNATSAPADGAITPLDWCTLPANGSCSITYNPGPPHVYSTGITAVITGAATIFTKTTGVITGGINGSVQ